MRKILSLIAIMLTMSVMIFGDKMPKEIHATSDKISLSTKNEVLYEGKLYTGKIIIDDASYMTLKDGHLEGKTFIENDEVKTSFNIVDGKLEGDYIQKGLMFGTDIDRIINFKRGKFNSYIGYIDSDIYNLTFDSNGNANGTFKDDETGIILNYKDGVTETEEGFVSKLNTGDNGDELLEFIFDKNGKLISEEAKEEYINREYIELFWFGMIFYVVAQFEY